MILGLLADKGASVPDPLNHNQYQTMVSWWSAWNL